MRETEQRDYMLYRRRWDLVKENTVGEDAFKAGDDSSEWSTDDGEEDSDDE